ncbi:MAG: hypothetical protein ACK5LY_00305 [Lachnospirales bacterium]
MSNFDKDNCFCDMDKKQNNIGDNYYNEKKYYSNYKNKGNCSHKNECNIEPCYLPIVNTKGDKGDRGDKGEKGDRGDQGIQGEKGDAGEKGEQGPQGVPGTQGVPGPQGVAGVQGVQGVAGPQGCGIPGPQGEQGVAGPAGPCCDPTCSNTLSTALSDIATKQKEILGLDYLESENLGEATISVISLPTLDDETNPFLTDVVIPENQESCFYELYSDVSLLPMVNLIEKCNIFGFCGDLNTEIGQWLLAYELPSYVDSSTCKCTIDKINFIKNLILYCPDKVVNIDLHDNPNIDKFKNVQIIEVSEGFIKIIIPPTGEPEEVCIISICAISRIYYEKNCPVLLN